ncbi:alpha/beta hydrolase [Massilia cavernae]|uniref:Monoacylglycerol lipase n=1 Tax=Massilia cavernae TaxID=2320864 RepID=A0A418X6U1_9BURK|nr:alpha/beta hydrolase [Massilia cavernae]RJG08216.1 lysophospholipase [Massilia cavernae]
MHKLSQTLSKLALALILLSFVAGASAGKDCLNSMAADTTPTFQSVVMRASDGVCLRTFMWRPDREPIRGVLVITHGIRDHALRYDGFARLLSAQGYAVFAQDLRGHAHSGGERQRFDSMQQMVADADLVVSSARQQYPSLPLFLYGHSLGGLITAEYTIAHSEHLRGVVLSGAALMRPQSVGAVSVFFARLVASLAPGFRAVAVDDHEFSRDPVVMSALAADPLISRDKLPAITAVASVDGMQDVQQKSAAIRVPILIMYGTTDKVNPIAGSQALMASVGSTDKTLKPYEGLYHDLLHEPEHQLVAADVIAWLNAHR